MLIPTGADTLSRAKALEYAGQIPSQGITGMIYSCGYAASKQDCPGTVNGNIALIERGGPGRTAVTFATKVTNAMAVGRLRR